MCDVCQKNNINVNVVYVCTQYLFLSLQKINKLPNKKFEIFKSRFQFSILVYGLLCDLWFWLLQVPDK
jgi:hypothetical protein